MGTKLQELLNNPAIQSGVAPFLVAVIVAELFHRIRLSGLAVIAGFAVTVYLASDFNMAPLTSSRKIVVLGLSAALLGLSMDTLRFRSHRSVLSILGGIAALWAVQRILQNQDTIHMLLWGTGCMAYVYSLIWGMDRTLDQSPLHTSSAAAALGLGTGAAALIGASALLGQFGLAIGSAALAHLFIQVLTNKTLPTGHILVLPVAMVSGLAGCIAVLSAKLPWYALLLMAVVPLTGSLIQNSARSCRINGPLLFLLSFAPAAVAIFLAWRSAGDIPI
jgi:hypothetical protein